MPDQFLPLTFPKGTSKRYENIGFFLLSHPLQSIEPSFPLLLLLPMILFKSAPRYSFCGLDFTKLSAATSQKTPFAVAHLVKIYLPTVQWQRGSFHLSYLIIFLTRRAHRAED